MIRWVFLFLLISCQSETPQAVQLQRKQNVDTEKYFQESQQEECDLETTVKEPTVATPTAPRLQGGNTGCSVD